MVHDRHTALRHAPELARTLEWSTILFPTTSFFPRIFSGTEPNNSAGLHAHLPECQARAIMVPRWLPALLLATLWRPLDGVSSVPLCIQRQLGPFPMLVGPVETFPLRLRGGAGGGRRKYWLGASRKGFISGLGLKRSKCGGGVRRLHVLLLTLE